MRGHGNVEEGARTERHQDRLRDPGMVDLERHARNTDSVHLPRGALGIRAARPGGVRSMIQKELSACSGGRLEGGKLGLHRRRCMAPAAKKWWRRKDFSVGLVTSVCSPCTDIYYAPVLFTNVPHPLEQYPVQNRHLINIHGPNI